MTLPTSDTVVTYPAGDTASAALVLHVEPLGNGRAAVLLDRTAVHPVDASWPDQGADHATVGGFEVVDCVVAATDGSALFMGADIPVRKGADGWAFVVAHIVDAATAPAEGDAVAVAVERGFRTALSAGHTACHLAAFALNAALANAWSKATRTDSLGSPDFDGLANETSLIVQRGASDVFRVGKSLRKAGFDPGALDDLGGLTDVVNERLATWVAAGGEVRVECDGDRLTDRRYWVTSLPEGEARVACGGTHVGSLNDVVVSVELTSETVDGALLLHMSTSAGPWRADHRGDDKS